MRYADLDDLFAFGAPLSAFRNVPNNTLLAHLDAASKRADSALTASYITPISTIDPPPAFGAAYPEELKSAVARVAAFEILSMRGYNPETDGGALRDRAKDAEAWLEKVGNGTLSPPDMVGSAHGPGLGDEPLVYTDRQRWSRLRARAPQLPDTPLLGVRPVEPPDDEEW